nr:unnamed protein product [Callosobruchus chinensis]
MDQESSIRLIELYQTYRFLWDAKDKHHHNKTRREDACKEISEKIQYPVPVLKAKMKTLMGSYRSEKSRENKSRVTGSGSQDVYYSKWFAYKYFNFLADKDNPRETVNTDTAENELPGLRGEARAEDSATPEKVWSLLFDEEVIEELVICTNRKMRTMSGQYNDETRTEMKDVDAIEMKAFLGLLIYSAVFKSNHEDVRLLFATDGTGRDIFRAVMSRERFTVLLASLRFDNPDDRNERQKTEPTAAISNVFQKFFKNSQKVYSLGANVCVDEMLIGFRGRCKFKMFMPQKPAKYGIKLMLLTDARTAYAYNGYIYSGKNSDGVELTQSESKFAKPTQAVLRLSKPIHGTNRNITADNWFSSIELVNTLKERKLTFVGTLKKNKREIPREFLPSRSKPQGSTMYGFTKECTILSYVTKKNKAVLLVSSMHHGESNGPSGKPVIIEYYNNTKGGVDALDEKCAVYKLWSPNSKMEYGGFL